ncbi:LysR family transcriptional regulator [Longispora fulva]|nr:LysR family transcriptional regulator [Longispora fulva]
MRHLRALCTISAAGSLTRAAATLGTTQPALSAQLQRIEKLLGGAVFTRDRTGCVPTAYGEYVLVRARAILADTDRLRHGPAGFGRRAVRLGGVSGPILVGLADRLGTALSGVEIELHAEHSPRLLVDLVGMGRLDLAAVVDYPGYELRPTPGVDWRIVADESVHVALGADHRLARCAALSLADLAAEPWVLPPPDGAGWPEYFHGVCHEFGFTPRVPHEVGALRPLPELLARGLALSPCQATFEPGGGVVVRPLTGEPLRMRHLVAWNRHGPLAEYADRLPRWAAEVYAASLRRLGR